MTGRTVIAMDLLHNTTSAPVAFDTAGHSVDGHGNTQGNTSDPVTRDLLDAGVLLIVPKPEKPKKTDEKGA